MKTIYKYGLDITDKQRIELPVGAELLSVQNQRGEINLWALVDSEAELEENLIECFGTGHPINIDAPRQHLGTIQIQDGLQIYHFFKLL